MPADNNYVAKPGDKVAARVKSDDEENWILAEVVNFNSSSNKYDVDDIDADEGKEYVYNLHVYIINRYDITTYM